jgi:hypothetical protein
LKQFKCYSLLPDLLHKYRVYYDKADWGTPVIGDCFEEYTLIADIDNIKEKVDSDWIDRTCMHFDSNHKPDCTGILDKWVSIKLKASWKGCNLPDQTFCCYKTWYCIDTEKGSLELVDNYGIFDPSFIFDICYDPSQTIGTLYMHSVGGYTPKDIDTITIKQEKSDGTLYSGIYEISSVIWEEYSGVLGDDPIIDALMDGCCETVYVGTVTFEPGQTLLDGAVMGPNDKLKLHANHPPAGYCCPDIDLDKWVSVDFESKWEGCGLADQEITYMLVHKNNISGIPNSRFHRQFYVIMFRYTFKIAV